MEAGDVVAVVEAMKMETSLTAPFRGRVQRVLASANVHVAAQAPLLALEPLDGAPQQAHGQRLSFESIGGPAEQAAPVRCRENLQRMEWLVLGYDIGAAEVQRAIADLHGECADLLGCDPALVPGEHRLLGMFADLRALWRPRSYEEESDADMARSPQEHLLAWLRSLDARAEGLSSRFVAQLRRALAHYGVESLDRTPALEEACYRLFLSHQRAETTRAAILAILDRRHEEADQLAGHIGDDFREALDRLLAALDGRDPAVADRAREVRFRYFDEPIIAEARARVYAEAEQHIGALTVDPLRADRDARIEALVSCPRPLATRLTAAMRNSAPPVRDLLLEAMTRRYYRVRLLEALRARTDRRRAVRAHEGIAYEGRTHHVAALTPSWTDVPARGAGIRRHAAHAAGGRARGARPVCPARAPGTLPRGARRAADRGAGHGPGAARASPDRDRRRRAATRPRDVGDRSAHVQARARRVGGGRGHPRPTPDDGLSPAAVAV